MAWGDGGGGDGPCGGVQGLVQAGGLEQVPWQHQRDH